MSNPSYADIADEFQEVKGEYAPTHDFDENDTLVGVYRSSREVNTRNGARTIYTVEQADGSNLDFWGSAIINSRMKDVPQGAKIKVVSTGRMVPTKNGRKAKEFSVFVAKGSLKQAG